MRMYAGAKRIYSHATKIANGANCGMTQIMTTNEEINERQAVKVARAEDCSVESTIFISAVNLLRIRPIGVTSKKREGALINLLSMATKSFLEA